MKLIALFGSPLLLALAIVPAARSGPVSPVSLHFGMCDASAAVALDAELFAVANDEDNTIRVYRAAEGGTPVQTYNLVTFLPVDSKRPETDLEGACWLGDRIFWITSHGRNHEGKYRSSRHFFFATTWEKTDQGSRLRPAGRPYQHLQDDLLREPRLKPFKLKAASKLPPKSPGAFNIEGLCQTPDGHLLLGFRNPIPFGRALLVPLLNPNELIEGKPARFGDPILLDLDGLGVRDIGFWKGRFIIVAGSADSSGESRLYQWSGGKTPPRRVAGVDLAHFNAEAVVVYPDDRTPFQLLSDDGTMEIRGVCCKKLPNPMEKQFRRYLDNASPQLRSLKTLSKQAEA